jgi:hypothetical protein
MAKAMDYSPMLSTPTLRPYSGAGIQSASGAAAFSTCEFTQIISLSFGCDLKSFFLLSACRITSSFAPEQAASSSFQVV